METVIYIAGALVFFALVMASVALHEVGHLVPAKLFGVKTTQYFVGFGRTLWSRRKGETEYGVKAIPLGGYVRMIGMYPPSKERPNQVRATRTGIFQSLADQARAAEYEEIRPEDDGRLLYQKKAWQKLIIMAGGPLMNVLLAFLILLGVTASYGVYRETLTVQTVSECIRPADSASPTCTPNDPPTPAKQAGLQAGDRILTFNGVRIESWEQLQQAIRANLDREARIVVLRDGEEVPLTPTRTVLNGVRDDWDPSRIIQQGFLGVTPQAERQRGGPVTVLGDMWDLTQRTGYLLVQFPVKVFNVARDLVTGKPRDLYGPMSIVGASRVAGEIASTDQVSLSDKLAALALTLGNVNLFLALFNLIPLLPMDGGHIAGAIYEALKRGLARLFRRPDPGHVDTARMLPVAWAVGIVVALSGAVLILADIFDPIRLFSG
ncbi:MAG TPA: site-2 protease family protein [Microlunatus sp.]|nr:site-2 protease family protein [Microlunatus sp.]